MENKCPDETLRMRRMMRLRTFCACSKTLPLGTVSWCIASINKTLPSIFVLFFVPLINPKTHLRKRPKNGMFGSVAFAGSFSEPSIAVTHPGINLNVLCLTS